MQRKECSEHTAYTQSKKDRERERERMSVNASIARYSETLAFGYTLCPHRNLANKCNEIYGGPIDSLMVVLVLKDEKHCNENRVREHESMSWVPVPSCENAICAQRESPRTQIAYSIVFIFRGTGISLGHNIDVCICCTIAFVSVTKHSIRLFVYMIVACGSLI